MVRATDPFDGQTAAEPVVQLIQHSGVHTMVAIGLATGAALLSTDGHPIWDASTNQFTDAANLSVGDKLASTDGTLTSIVTLTSYQADLTAYNLHISNIHTYYAGATPVLVHNSCGFPDLSDMEGADPEDVLDRIPNNWEVSSPSKGEGIAFRNPDNDSHLIMMEKGSGDPAEGVHAGPYLRVSDGTGRPVRIPLSGNPALGGQ